MKKNRTLIILTVVLGGLATYFLMKDNSSSFKTALRDFSVKDTAAITKIFLADRNGKSVTLHKNPEGKWFFNDSLSPRKDMIKSLMDVIYKVDVKENVAKSAYNNVIKTLSSTGIKCEIYLNNESTPSKVYYVGGATPDDLGTYMWMEDSRVPYITEIPGFNGYLTPRYCVSPTDWKEPIIFSYTPAEIQKISVSYTAFPQRSFELIRNKNSFQISGKSGASSVQQVDSVAIDNYLDLFKSLSYESLETTLSPAQHDSLKQTNTLCSVSVTDIKNQQRSIDIYPMPVNEKSLTLQDSLGKPLKYDVDRMIGYFQNTGEWVVIQHYTFDRIFRSPEDFDSEVIRKRILKLQGTRP